MFPHITDKFIIVIKKDTISKSSECLTCNGAKYVSLFISIQGSLSPNHPHLLFFTHTDAADIGSPATSVLVQGNSLGPEQSDILRGCFQIRMETARHPDTASHWPISIWCELCENLVATPHPWLRIIDTSLSLQNGCKSSYIQKLKKTSKNSQVLPKPLECMYSSTGLHIFHLHRKKSE